MSIEEHHAAIQSAIDDLATAIQAAREDRYMAHLDWIVATNRHEINADMTDVRVRLEYAP